MRRQLVVKAKAMKEIIGEAWQVVQSWATARPMLFAMIMIGGILVTSAKLRGKTSNAEDDTGARQASLFTRIMSRSFSGRSYNYDRDLRMETEIDQQDTQYEDEDEGGYEVKEEHDGETRAEEEEKEKGKSLEEDSEIKAEIQEEMQQKLKYSPRNEKPSLSRRTRQSSRVPPGEGSSGEMVVLSESSGEIAGAASSSTRKVRLPPPPAPAGLRKSGSFLSSLVSFGRGTDRNIAQSTELNKKKQGETNTEASTTEVDTEAEDFIRKFRRQLKLQRLESILQRQVKTDK
jgi:hypothetical protein